LADGLFFSGFTLTAVRIRSSKFDFVCFVFNNGSISKSERKFKFVLGLPGMAGFKILIHQQ